MKCEDCKNIENCKDKKMISHFVAACQEYQATQ